MPRKGHTEEQIVRALREAEAGKKVGDVCRELGVSQQAFYSWKRRFAGLGLPSCENCGSCEKRTASSRRWWQI